MKKLMIRRKRKERSGMALIAALVIVVILGFIVSNITEHVYAVHRINQYNIAREKAAMVAEAGLYKLIWIYTDVKEEYNQLGAGETVDSIAAPIGISDPNGNWVEIARFYEMFKQTYFAEGGVQARDSLYDGWQPGQVLMTFIDDSLNNNLIELGESKVIELQVLFPRLNADAGTVFTFKSTARSTLLTGATVDRTVLFDVNFKKDFLLKALAGIVSGTNASTNGQFNLHWGEAWSKTNLCLVGNVKKDLNNPPAWDLLADNTQNVDQWTKYKTATGHVTDNKTPPETLCDNSDIYDLGKWGPGKYIDQIYQFCDQHTPSGEPTLSQIIDETLRTFAELNDPDIGYEFWKDVAIRRDTYIRPGEDGNIYDSKGQQLFKTKDGEITRDSSESPATIDDALEHYRLTDKVFVFFIDTIDGNPPVTDGSKSNWCDIKISGDLTCASRGLLYVAGDFALGGNPPNERMDIYDPNGEVLANQRVFHDGIIFTFGTYDNQGFGIIYGSVMTQGGYLSGGNPTVYYNAHLADGEPYQISSPVTIRRVLVESGLHQIQLSAAE